MAPTAALGRALAGLTALSGLPGLAACGGGGEATPNTNTVTQATTLVYWTNLGGAGCRRERAGQQEQQGGDGRDTHRQGGAGTGRAW